MPTHFLYIIDVLGTISFAVSGAFLAIEKRLDPFGVSHQRFSPQRGLFGAAGAVLVVLHSLVRAKPLRAAKP